MANQTINQITKFIGKNEKLFWGVLALLALVYFMNPTGTAVATTQSILGLEIASETVIIFSVLAFVLGGGVMYFSAKLHKPKLIFVGAGIALISYLIGAYALIDWINNMVSGFRIGTWAMIAVLVLITVAWAKPAGLIKGK